MQPGTLYVVGTPIGNLKDITLRALEVLGYVDFIISEDSRVASKLLRAYDIDKKQISYRDENKNKAIPRIRELLQSGANLALITDSGTPTISDPGFKLIADLQAHNIKVESVPGPSAVIAALSIAGLPTDKFSFVGFLPRKGNERNNIILTFGNLENTLVIYESPYRVKKTLADIEQILGDRYCAVVKELTKIYEHVFFGNISNVIKTLPDENLKGEFVILIAKSGFMGKINHSGIFS